MEVAITSSEDPIEIRQVPKMPIDEDFIHAIMVREEPASRPHKHSKEMYKVPQMLRSNTMQNCEEYYKPSVVSIGPYHSCDSRLEKVKKLKPKIAKEFHKKETETDLRQFFKEFKEKIKEHNFKVLYSNNTTEPIEDELFGQIMFLDGCFILGFIQCIANDGFDKLGMKNNLIKSVQKDLFLLENQLPYKVLLTLIELVNSNTTPGSWEEMLAEFVDWNNCFSFNFSTYRSHFYWNDIFYLNHFALINRSLSRQEDLPDHLLHLQLKRLVGKPSSRIRFCLPASCETSNRIHLFRGVKELTQAGIKLRPNQAGYLNDVGFWSYGFSGTLALPCMTIDNSTKAMFFNLIAYEECIAETEKMWFTSYFSFLDLLIDHAEDVKELRIAGILDNRLSSDEEVAKLFNEIAVNMEPVADTYDHIKRRIRLHFNVRKRFRMVLWVFEGLRDHFKSPWTWVAVLGALVVFSLTVVQTVYTVSSQKPQHAP